MEIFTIFIRLIGAKIWISNLLSIITLTYNNLDDLRKTVSTLPAISNIESLIINGGSDKETFQFLETYKGVVINEKDEGISDAFNKGITNSSGDYIMFLNGGDELLDDRYPDNAAEILDNKSEYSFVHSNMVFVDKSGIELYVRPSLKNIGRGMPYLHPTMIVRKTVFEKIGGFNKKFKISMDYDWVVRLEKEGFKGYHMDQEAPVRMDGSGKSVTEEGEAIKECYRILRENGYLNLKNRTGFFIRYFFYFGRRFLSVVGLNRLLISLKKSKHSR
jgi:glycosyltransferase involved in cell wall biosynthesis